MLFSSLTFIFVFLPLLLILYFLVKNIKLKNIILLIFSLIFYAWGEPIYVFLMIFCIFITFVFGILIDKYKDNKKKKKVLLFSSIMLLLLNLAFFKYCNFFIQNINFFFKLNVSKLNISLPIGISFYTFQAISYLADLYKNEIKIQKNFLNLALYISLFPQLIAGPIVRYQTIEEQINKRGHSVSKIVLGFKRFILGLSKKVLLANSMAAIADSIFDGKFANGTFILWLGAFAYSLQIYYDFSGYSDMAIGLGKVFGFDFLENFDYPYISKSITEFWRRWHISLSTWFRDYVYIPLGGSRTTKIKHIRNIIIVWVLTGFWHGASWNFIFWGLYYCILLLIEKYLLKKYINSNDKFLSIIKHTLTIILIMIGWVIFRVTDLNTLLISLERLFIYKKSDFLGFLFSNCNLIINYYFILPSIIFCLPITKKLIIKINKDKIINKIVIDSAYIVLYLINIMFLVSNTYNPFIYFRF